MMNEREKGKKKMRDRKGKGDSWFCGLVGWWRVRVTPYLVEIRWIGDPFGLGEDANEGSPTPATHILTRTWGVGSSVGACDSSLSLSGTRDCDDGKKGTEGKEA